MTRSSRVICALSALLLASCASTRTVADLEEIQNTKGIMSKSLFYVGSSKSYHYFDQFTFLGDGWWIPFHKDDGFTSYKVARKGLPLPEDLEFPHSDYKGSDDERSIKVRIRSAPAPRVEKRTYRPISLNDYRVKLTGPSTITIERIR